uniref:Nucleosome assembly protein n=1 Tax=Rhabditophanes sp. KR3021 TaxID=114890 RepID=A0AC35TN05_9BILA
MFPVINDALALTPSHIENAPPHHKNLLKALKKNQDDVFKIEDEFYQKLMDIEVEFNAKYAKVYEDRRALVNGLREPSADELNEKIIAAVDIEHEAKMCVGPVETTKGIKDFWFNTLLHHQHIGDQITEKDGEILKELKDITLDYFKKSDEDQGFVLSFIFGENNFFEQEVLKKTYQTSTHPMEGDLKWNYAGNYITSVESTHIAWKAGKNPGQGVNAAAGPKKMVETPSFFDYFKINNKIDHNSDEDERDLLNDFDLGQILRDEVIPRAILIYTGEYVDEDFDYQDYEEDSDNEDEAAEE